MNISFRSRYGALSIVVLFLMASLLLYVHLKNNPSQPHSTVVHSCGNRSASSRIGGPHGYQFEVAKNTFSVQEGTQDMPPFEHGYRLTPKDGSSVLEISFGKIPMPSMSTDPRSTVSKQVIKRNIVDQNGNVLGDDYWGYLTTGEQWREIRLYKGGVLATYGFSNRTEAKLFDHIMNSVCVLPD